MRLAIVLACLLAGCVTPNAAFECSTSADCSGGTCEPDGLCSFADATCDSGRRYGEASGDKSGQCVEGGAASVCGDGIVSGIEECDDGNSVAIDFCSDCKVAKCGDGAVLANIEECDDGNTVDGDGCNANCLDCGAGSVTNPANGHCYVVVEAAETWDDAGDDCAAKGGYLATIGDSAENAFVSGLLVTATDYWIGLQDFSANNYFWEDGFRLGTFQGWDTANGEPSTGGSDETTAMQQANGLWDQQDRDNTHPYVCERSPWTIEPMTHHAYRAITGRARQTYSGARAGCAALPGAPHLVTITDAAEQTFVDAVSSATQTYIGLDDITTEGTYVWASGEPFSFFAWGVNEPTGSSSENCVVLREDGTWGDRDCELLFASKDFICELDPAP